jgi:hypothetical protein
MVPCACPPPKRRDASAKMSKTNKAQANARLRRARHSILERQEGTDVSLMVTQVVAGWLGVWAAGPVNSELSKCGLVCVAVRYLKIFDGGEVWW